MLDEFKRDRVAQLLLVAVVIIALIACGIFGLTAITFITRTQAVAPAQLQPPSAAPPQSPPETGQPTQAEAPPPQNIPDETRRTYMAFLFLQSSQVLLEETARQVEAGEVEGFEALGQLLVVGAFLKGTGEAFQQPPPDANFQPAWEKARTAVPLVQQVIKSWVDKEIGAADVPTALAEARTTIDETLALSDQIMVERYGVDSEKLNQFRTEAMNEMRQSLAQGQQGEPAATEVPLYVAILSSSDYVDSIGSYWIVGEAQNNSTQPVRSVNIIATFYNDAGEVVGTKTTYTDLDILLPAQKGPFKILADDNPQAARYELQLEARPSAPPETHLQILSANDRADDSYLHIAGEVANQGSAPVEFVKIVATIYDDQGRVVDVDSTYSSLDTIPAGGKSPFEIQIFKRDGFARYELQAQGR